MRKKCRAKSCESIGRKHRNGNYYLSKGLCGKHYCRLAKGQDINGKSSRDGRPAIVVNGQTFLELGINGKDGYALIDNSFKHLDRYKWWKSDTGYAATSMSNDKTVFLHHMVIGKPKKGLVTDHINRNKLDNRLTNLRHISYSGNTINTGLRSDNSTGHRGIYFVDRPKPWYAVVHRGGKIVYGKTFLTLEDAIIERRNFVDRTDDKTTK